MASPGRGATWKLHIITISWPKVTNNGIRKKKEQDNLLIFGSRKTPP